MRRVLASAVLILMAVAWLVATAVWNRTAIVSRITVTERELPWTYPMDEQAVRLSLDWERRLDAQDARNWLTVDRLRQIGFDLGVPATSPEAGRVYARVHPRRAWVVFELEGETWRAVERRRAVTEPEPAGDRPAASRLIPVDAGLDVAALVERYPDGRHLIAPAWIQLGWVGPGEGGPLVYGSIRDVEPSSLTLPRPFADRLRAMAPPSSSRRDERPDAAPPRPAGPRYEVDLAVGRLGIPWIVDVR
jgi:hypothetical protein